jgi:hypothetical protein
VKLAPCFIAALSLALRSSGAHAAVPCATFNVWRMAVVWLMAVGIASMIYFWPAARLVE